MAVIAVSIVTTALRDIFRSHLRWQQRYKKTRSELKPSDGGRALKIVSVKMPEALIDGMDELVSRGVYPSRSAVMRTAIRDLLRSELWKKA